MDYWGHTAIVVRQGGKIVLVRGFNPEMSFPGGWLRLLRESKAIEAGRSSVPAVISADEYLFTHPRAMTVEWPVDPALAEQAALELGPTGPAGELGYAGEYTARPAQFRADACSWYSAAAGVSPRPGVVIACEASAPVSGVSCSRLRKAGDGRWVRPTGREE